MSRKFCARVSCGARASAVLLINARDLAAHVVDFREHTDVAGVPLCRAHADAVVVPLGWTLADLRTPAGENEFEPELVLVDDTSSDSPESSGTLRFPTMQEADEEDMEEAAGGEIPPLLSRAFRAAGLD